MPTYRIMYCNKNMSNNHILLQMYISYTYCKLNTKMSNTINFNKILFKLNIAIKIKY